MSAVVIEGGCPLTGELSIQGSKNAALPILAASILVNGTTRIKHCPKISDSFCMIEILKVLGCQISWEGMELIINAENIDKTAVPDYEAGRMRSSVILLGALLGRKKEAQIAYPGGCSIGKRPIDIHLLALEKMGAELSVKDSGITGKIKKVKEVEITFSYPSVGAVQNCILASVLSETVVTLKNCAREPEITELCRFLNQAGAEIKGVGTDTIIISGVKELQEITYQIRGDRIAAGTYLAAGAITYGRITVKEINPSEISAILKVFVEMGCNVKQYHSAVCISKKPEGFRSISYLRTAPYPGFPTDMQSVIMCMAALADGISIISETVFEDRLKTAYELMKMGANITVDQNKAIIQGVHRLHPAEVCAMDLRGGAALVLAALATEGTSRVKGYSYVERGYEYFAETICLLGGHMRKDS